MQHLRCLERLLLEEQFNQQDGVTAAKKLFFLMHQGELRINGQLPNREFLLSDYFLDGYRVMLDWSALSDHHSDKLRKWLFVSGSSTLKTRFSDTYRILETSGRPEEKKLGVLGWLTNSLLFKRRYYFWDLPHDFLSNTFELNNINYCIARSGALFDFNVKHQVFNRTFSPASREYCGDPSKQNIKRVYVTNEMVDKLKNFDRFDFKSALRKAHPMAIKVRDHQLRYVRMKAHRTDNRYEQTPWLIRYLKHWVMLLDRWFFHDSWFGKLFKKWRRPKHKKQYSPFIDEKDISIEIDAVSGEVFVRERRPKFDTYVLCGGGARIYGHIGAIEEFCKNNITAQNFAGSSAGAIMSLMLYLGYKPSEIRVMFQWFRQENLVEYSVQLSGLSTANKLKKAFDWVIYNTLFNEVERHKERFESVEGSAFLKDWIYPPNKITFKALRLFKEFCPESSLGESLLVTATHKASQQTHYFSHHLSPNHEVSEIVTASASLPVVYHPRGRYIDGGVKNNLPLNHFKQDESTFLEHQLRANYKVMAFQFDTGCEHEVLYGSGKVFKEGYLLNLLYSFLTGVANPAIAWMLERRHLRRYACQSLVIDVSGIKMSRFDVDRETCQYMINQGRKSAREYLKSHFSLVDGIFHRDEAMYQSFENLEELIHCAFRRRQFKLISKLKKAIAERLPDKEKDDLLAKIKCLEEDSRKTLKEEIKKKAMGRKFVRFSCKKERKESFDERQGLYSIRLFHMLYPVLVQNWTLVLPKGRSKKELREKHYRHFLREIVDIRDQVLIDNPFPCYERLKTLLDKQTGETHLLVYLLKWALKDLSIDNLEQCQLRVRKLAFSFSSPLWQGEKAASKFIANWESYDLSDDLCDNLLNLLQKDLDLTSSFVDSIKKQTLSRQGDCSESLSIPLEVAKTLSFEDHPAFRF